MKLIDAVWDTRNLGLRCLEIEFAASDSVEVLSQAQEAMSGYDFVTAKVPVGGYDILQLLQKEGFSFVESLLSLEHKLEEFELPRLPARFEPYMSYEVLNPEDYGQVFDELDRGLFDTDRISLDSHFSIEDSARRYKNWILDESKRDLSVLQVSYKDTVIGFISHSARGEVSYPFLASLYKSSQQTGLGANLVMASIRYARENGFKRIETVISSNNYPIVKIHELLGYSLKKIEYVLTCHCEHSR